MTAFSDKAYSLTRPLLISATSWSRSACRCLLAGNACVVTRDVPGAIECNTNCVLYSFITASCVQSAKHWLLLFAESNSGFWTFCKHTQNSRSSHRDGSGRLGRGDRTTFYTMFWRCWLGDRKGFKWKLLIFTRESNSVCLSLCPSITRLDQSKTVQATITKSSPSAA